jgi:hypothetical protein
LEKSSRSDFQEEDLIAINQIIIRCAVKFQKVIEKHFNPEDYGNKMAVRLKSNKNICSLFLFPQILNIKSDDLYSPSELKARILQDMRPMADDITNEIVSDKYMSNSTLSKVYKEFMHDGLLVHLDNKDQLKSFRAMHAKDHKNIYKTEGRISFYTVSPSFETTRRLLSNPAAMDIINASLSKSGLVDRSLKIMTKASFYLFVKGGFEETEIELLKQAIVSQFKALYPSLQLDMNDWEIFRDKLSSLGDNLLEIFLDKAAEIIVPRFKELGFPYIIYGLSKL